MNAIQCYGPEDTKGILPWSGSPGVDTFEGLRKYFLRYKNGSAVTYTVIIDMPNLLVATRRTYVKDDLSVWVITV